MIKHSPWQSWSPSKPSFFGIPAWDYCPLPLPPTKRKKVKKPKAKSINYWCSWYAFSRKINEKLILEQAILIKQKKMKIDYVLIDDGWTKWGDWKLIDETKFKNGLSFLSKQLAKKKFKTGLWLAPFLAEKKSNLFKEHPEYFLRDRLGRPVNGFKSFPLLDDLFHPRFLLDFSKKEVQKHIFESMDQMIEKWGISLLKLDFLYAPYFNPHLKNAKEASKQVKKLLTYLKKKHPQTFIIACGCPFSDAVGLVDAIRISKDTGFTPLVPAFIRNKFYHHRVEVLKKKLEHRHLWEGCLADPDVKMLAFDNARTNSIFEEFNNEDSIRGFGDDMREISRGI